MANPNIVSATQIYARTTGVKAMPTGTNTLLSNASSSGKAFLVESLIVANTDTNAVSVSVSHWNNATPGATGATGVAICSSVNVPSGQSLVVLEKVTSRNLLEGQSLAVVASAGGKLDVSCDYKEIS